MSPRIPSHVMAATAPRQSRRAAFCFGIGVVVAFFVLLQIGAEQSFYLDEWDYLSARTAWDPSDLLRPHNEHWSTLPILLYRALYRTVGLGSYLPYRAFAVAAHLAAATAMRLLLRRIGLGPWLASAVVLPWILFGAGRENIVWGFQVAWSAALALALTQLLLADHGGRRDIRDAAGLLAGLAGLMSAGIAVPMTATVGLCLVLRRGWRVALLHVAPLAAVYGWWTTSHGDTSLFEPAPDWDKLSFTWTSLASAVSSFSWWPGLGALVAVMGLALVGVAVRRSATPAQRHAVVIPASFGAGAVGYLYVVASGRAIFGAETARASRYQHVVMLLLLPAVGLAAHTAMSWASGGSPRARKASFAIVILVLWAGIPGNLVEFSERDPAGVRRGQIDRVEAMAAAVRGRADLPPDGQPFEAAPLLTIGWLQEATAEGVLRAVEPEDPRIVASLARDLQLLLVDRDADPSTCEALRAPLDLAMEAGDTVSFKGLTVIVDVDGPNGTSTRRYDLTEGHTLYATERIRVVLRPVFAGIRLCDRPID